MPVAVRDGLRDFYSPEGRAALREFVERRRVADGSDRLRRAHAFWQMPKPTGSPLLYAAFAAVTTGNYEADYARFQALSSLLAAGALVWLGVLLGIPAWAMLAACGVLQLTFSPLLADIVVANVNRLLVFLSAAYLALRFAAASDPTRRWPSLASGFMLALAILFKPLFVPAIATLALTRLVRRQYRPLLDELAGGVLGAAVALGGTWLVFGSPLAWAAWLDSVPAILAEGVSADQNFAPRHVLAGGGVWTALAFSVLLLAAQGVALRRNRPDTAEHLAREDVHALGVGLLLCLWLEPVTWLHYYALALPWLLYVFAEAARRRAVMPAALAVASIVSLQLATPMATVMGLAALTVAMAAVAARSTFR